MTTDPAIAHEEDNLSDAIKRMRSVGGRRLPVVNDLGGLEGIVSIDDLIDLVAEELSELSALVSRRQREHEAKSSPQEKILAGETHR